MQLQQLAPHVCGSTQDVGIGSEVCFMSGFISPSNPGPRAVYAFLKVLGRLGDGTMAAACQKGTFSDICSPNLIAAHTF